MYNCPVPSLCSSTEYEEGSGGKNASLDAMLSTTLPHGPLWGTAGLCHPERQQVAAAFLGDSPAGPMAVGAGAEVLPTIQMGVDNVLSKRAGALLSVSDGAEWAPT